jgi:hypothetical protein
MTNVTTTTPVLRYRAAKKTLQAAQARFDLANAGLTADVKSADVRAEWCQAMDALIQAEIACDDARDIAYPMPDVEVTDKHVIIRRFIGNNHLEAHQTAKDKGLKLIYRGAAQKEIQHEREMDAIWRMSKHRITV